MMGPGGMDDGGSESTVNRGSERTMGAARAWAMGERE